MRKEKELLLKEVQDKIQTSTGMIIASYDKLEPNTSWRLREELLKKGSIFEVVRKRVFVKAAQNAGIEFDDTLLKGHVGVVFINQPDTMASAKALYKFSEDNANLLQIICGQVDGKIMPGGELEQIAKLPGLDEMRAIFIGLITAPMSQVLSVMEAVIAEPNALAQQISE